MNDSLVTYVEQQAGEYLRTVALYDDSGFEILYRRDDLGEARVTNRVQMVYDNITWDWNPDDDGLSTELGATQATLQVRNEAIIIQLVTGDTEGYLISLAPGAARNLTTFLKKCLDHIE
jgi:hypothetical protein